MIVYLVNKNADFTEGRGPMLPHRLFKNADDAHNYIMDQSGIFGSDQYKNSYGYNGYSISEMVLIESYDKAEIAKQKILLEKKKAELKKLQEEIDTLMVFNT